MADEKTVAASAVTDELMEDLDAFAPKPIPFRFKGKVYEVRAFADLTYDETFEMTRLEERIKTSKSWLEQMELMRQQTKFMAPAIPDEILGAMSRRQMLQVSLISAGGKLRPPEAETNGSAV